MSFLKRIPENFIPFLQVKNKLFVEDGIILRGSCIFMPPKFWNFVMDELHSTHQGISTIKDVARSYVWRPGIDTDLEIKVKGCAYLPAKCICTFYWASFLACSITTLGLHPYWSSKSIWRRHTIDNHWCKDKMVRSCTSSKLFILC